MKTPNKLILLSTAISTFLLMSCTRPQQEKSTLKINFPKLPVTSSEKNQTVSKNVTALSTTCDSGNWDCSVNPTFYSDIDCFGVAIGGSEASFSENMCYKSDNSFSMTFGPMQAFIDVNSSAVFELPSGTGRTVYLFGVKKGAGQTSCNDIVKNGPSGEYSRPILLGSVSGVNMLPGNVTHVDIPVYPTLDTTKYFDDCQFGSGSGSGGGPTGPIGGMDCPTGTDHAGQDWSPTSGSEISGEHCNINNFNIPSGGVNLAQGIPLMVYANKINFNGSIYGDSKGFSPQSGPGAAVSPNIGAGNGGYGGGAYGGSQGLPSPDITFPSETMSMGSGAYDAFGGGYVLLQAFGSIVVNNYVNISVRGGASSNSGGSGGGIVFITPSITFGTYMGSPYSIYLDASGGSGGTSAGGGSGGRIYIEAGNFAGVNYTAGGGSGNGGADYSLAGGSGTIYKIPYGAPSGEIEISNGTETYSPTPIANFAGIDNVKLSGGMYIHNGDLDANSPSFIFNGGSLKLGSGSNVSRSLNITAGKLVIDEAAVNISGNINISGSATMYAESPTASFGNITVGSGGTITHKQFRGTPQSKLYLNASNLTVDSGGKIDVSSKGYSATYGPGAPVGSYQGGTYGGVGGGSSSAAYGSSTDPNDWGSGGYGSAGDHQYYWMQGSGGGVARIKVSNSFVLNGSINSDGYTMGCCIMNGSGSGGSILVKAYNFSGSGSITANGGSANSGGGGGGGRIAVYYESKTFSGSVTASGGSPSGGIGSTYDGGNASYGTAPEP